MLNFILADDHPLYRKALCRIIDRFPQTNKVSEAENGDEVLRLMRTEKTDLIFMDYNMPGLNGYDASVMILKQFPETKIIILTQYDEMPVILNFFKIGVKGFLTKNAGEKEIVESIHIVIAGNYYYHSRYQQSISKWLAEGVNKNVPSIKFSTRDMTLIAMMSRGKTSQEISYETGLSVRSVETYRYNLLRRAGVANTVELLDYVYRNGIVD